ncbi:hypothetical protein PAPYR_1490 [Paratrimastix pyriformis]|uniref:F-box domain-containing protein n=1 Tax=Paratrimastix pyriformis TaxID=342808 RepID=A0ABQ8UWU0_9EUKA|nr:hypothetical protein PAPYR_1490 [Paratrimastix pyriformis]
MAAEVFAVPELVELIFSCLDIRSLASVKLVCRGWNQATKSTTFWRGQCRLVLHPSILEYNEKKPSTDWVQLYRSVLKVTESYEAGKSTDPIASENVHILPDEVTMEIRSRSPWVQFRCPTPLQESQTIWFCVDGTGWRIGVGSEVPACGMGSTSASYGLCDWNGSVGFGGEWHQDYSGGKAVPSRVPIGLRLVALSPTQGTLSFLWPRDGVMQRFPVARAGVRLPTYLIFTGTEPARMRCLGRALKGDLPWSDEPLDVVPMLPAADPVAAPPLSPPPSPIPVPDSRD